MKKFTAFIFSLFTFLVGINVVSAACTAEEINKLNGLAVNVKVSYEKMQGELSEEEYSPPDGITEDETENYVGTYDFFRVYITNLTEDIYVSVYNDATNESFTFSYQDSSNGTVSFDWENVRTITNFTITVYSSGKTNCRDTKLYTTYITTPKFNEYSEYELCEGNEEFYLCHEFLSVNDVEFDKFVELIEKYKNGKVNDDGEDIIPDVEKDKSFIDFIKENKGLVIGISVGILLAGGLVTVIIVKKQRSRIV